jgi:hypothetical protein
MKALLTLLLTLGADPLPEPAKLPALADWPDPLTALDGTKITTPEAWKTKRRPEIARLFDHYMYGAMPKAHGPIVAKVRHESKTSAMWVRELDVAVGPDAPVVRLLVVLPPPGRAPKAVFVGPNFNGNHVVLPDPGIAITKAWVYPDRMNSKNNQATEEGRGKGLAQWNAPMIVEKGYGLATFYGGEVDPDRGEERGGLQPWLRARESHSPDRWGTIALYAWAMSRMADALAQDPATAKAPPLAVGHSRMGKTALLAAAMDERFAMSFPLQAGCGGTAPSRGKIGESVKQINDRFPHWFNSRFKEFNERPEKLPFDQHHLVSLAAPRPVLFANAVEDSWANPAGQFEVLRAADPVYRLLGAGGCDAREMPAVGALTAGTLGYWIRPGKHEMKTDDWRVFLEFADRYLPGAR